MSPVVDILIGGGSGGGSGKSGGGSLSLSLPVTTWVSSAHTAGCLCIVIPTSFRPRRRRGVCLLCGC